MGPGVTLALERRGLFESRLCNSEPPCSLEPSTIPSLRPLSNPDRPRRLIIQSESFLRGCSVISLSQRGK